MKAGTESIHYRMMRRIVQGVALATGSAAVFGSLAMGQASAATQSANSHVAAAPAIPEAPPPPGSCNASRKNWVWYDLDNHVIYVCVQWYTGQWEWEQSGTFFGGCPSSSVATKP